MADTQFELLMNEFVRQNLSWRTWVQYRNAAGEWVTNAADIKEGLDYRVGFKVLNGGFASVKSETSVKDVMIRVANTNPARVTFYSDDTYAQVEPNQLNSKFPAATVAPGQETPWHWVHIRLGPGPDETVEVASVGVYAEIVPQGRSWGPFFAPLD